MLHFVRYPETVSLDRVITFFQNGTLWLKDSWKEDKKRCLWQLMYDQGSAHDLGSIVYESIVSVTGKTYIQAARKMPGHTILSTRLLIAAFNDDKETTHEVLMSVLYDAYEKMSGNKHPNIVVAPTKPQLEPEVIRSFSARAKHLTLTAVALALMVLPL